jgi:hypothetical protein
MGIAPQSLMAAITLPVTSTSDEDGEDLVVTRPKTPQTGIMRHKNAHGNAGHLTLIYMKPKASSDLFL